MYSEPERNTKIRILLTDEGEYRWPAGQVDIQLYRYVNSGSSHRHPEPRNANRALTPDLGQPREPFSAPERWASAAFPRNGCDWDVHVKQIGMDYGSKYIVCIIPSVPWDRFFISFELQTLKLG